MSQTNGNNDHRAPGTSSEPVSFEDVVEIRFETSALTLDLVSAALFSLECQGTIVDDSTDETLLTAWLPDDTTRAAITTLSGFEGVTAAIVRRERVDWLDHYEQSLESIEVGSRFVIAPRRDLVEQTGRISLIVPQEQAFGTGGHESTAMCIELLETTDIEGKRCVDVGTGSGILAIAMAKLGAARVFAFDNDVETWGVIDRNLARNEVADGRIFVFYGSAEAMKTGSFEVAMMNILPHVILELLPHVIPSLVDGATLIVSGILATQKDEFLTGIAEWDLTLEDERTRGEWWAGLLRK